MPRSQTPSVRKLSTPELFVRRLISSPATSPPPGRGAPPTVGQLCITSLKAQTAVSEVRRASQFAARLIKISLHMPTLTCSSINSSIRSDVAGLLMAVRIGWWGGGELRANSGLQEFPSVPCHPVVPERVKRISGRFHLRLLLLLLFFSSFFKTLIQKTNYFRFSTSAERPRVARRWRGK